MRLPVLTTVEYWIEGTPVTWKRTALYRGRRITHAGQRQAQREHQLAALAARPRGWRLDGDMVVWIDLHVTTARRFDIDNAAKLILDALTGVVWDDDSQVSELYVRRVRTDKAGTWVRVRRAA